MAYQGMILLADGHALKVAFPFGGQVHEVHLPPLFGQSPYGFAARYQPGSLEARTFLREEATTMLQCLTARAALEQQRALATAGQPATALIEVPLFLSELHGSFGDLVQQLQECVHERRGRGIFKFPSLMEFLCQAASQGHTAAAQQLLLIEPNAMYGEDDDTGYRPVHIAARRSLAVLSLMLDAAPDALFDTGYSSDDERDHWTLMHSAAEGDNVEAVRLLLQRAPELASASTSDGTTPLHEAAVRGCLKVVRLLLEAAPEAAAIADTGGWLPMHWAAVNELNGALRTLLDAGAPGLDVPDADGELPLHIAVREGQEAAVPVLLAAHPAAAVVKDSEGRLPLQLALQYRHFSSARALLLASGLSAAQLLDLLADVPAQAQPELPPLYADLAAHMSLTPEQWLRVPAPCPGLGRALPTVLARSEAEAALLVARLPPAARKRLRTAALSLHRVQCSLQLEAAVPAALVGRMLALVLADD